MGWLKVEESVVRDKIDRWARAVQDRMWALFRRDVGVVSRLEDALHGRWLGQPLHVALVHVPVGTWTAAAVMDLFSENPAAHHAATYSILVGLLFAVPAMITGLVDWFPHTGDSTRRIGFVHMVANFSAFVLYSLSLWIRFDDNLFWALLTGYLGFACLTVSAFLGRFMVYRNRVGVNEAVLPEAREGFVTVAYMSELQHKRPHRVWIGEGYVILVRMEDRVFALADTCSYAGGSLAHGRVIGECLISPDNLTAFRLEDGQVVRGPGIYAQPVFEVHLRGQEVRVKAARLPLFDDTPIVRRLSLR